MIARPPIAAAALLLLGAAGEGPFTLSVARSLSHDALERRVFQGVSGTVREVSMRGGEMSALSDDVAFQIDFAGAPGATEFPGLCSAEVRTAWFGPGGKDFGQDTPVRLQRLANRRRFAISAADLARGARPSTARCTALGPVLSAPHYFAAYGNGGGELSESNASIAIRSIQRLIAGNMPIRCEEDALARYDKGLEPLCDDRGGLMKSLDWASLSYLASRNCGEERTCITAFFDRPNATSPLMKVQVELAVSGIDIVNGELRSPGKIGSASITGVTAVD